MRWAAAAKAAESLGAAPMVRMTGVSANGYRYSEGRGPFGSREPPYLKTVAAMAPRVEELWDRGWRLEIEARGREIAAFDYESLDLSELIERIESMAQGVSEDMALMFQASHLVSFSRVELLEFVRAISAARPRAS